MGLARVDIRQETVLKDFLKHPDGPARYKREVDAYTEIPWACPKLLWHSERWLEVERLQPLIDLGPDLSRKYCEPLRELLQAIHDAGWWHMDVDLINAVIHPTRGVLLIDWENFSQARTNVSYDLYGARAAGVPSPWKAKGPDGVWWGSSSPTSPKNYWQL